MPRIDVGGYVYHVINRANARAHIFDSEQDYKYFEEILEEAVEKFDIFCLPRGGLGIPVLTKGRAW